MKSKKIFCIMLMFIIYAMYTNYSECFSKSENILKFSDIAENNNDLYIIKAEKNEAGYYEVKSNKAEKYKTSEEIENIINTNNSTDDSVNLTSTVEPEGFLDTVNSDIISGWAWRRDMPNSPIDVHIYLDNLTTGKTYGPYGVLANVYRSDLSSAGIGNGYHAYQYFINWNKYPVGNYRINVHGIGGSNPLLNSSGKTFYASEPTGCLDKVDNQFIAGWAMRDSEPNEPIEILIAIKNKNTGGTYVYSLQADLYRDDLKKAGKGNGKHSFNFKPPWKEMTPGEYTIDVYGTDGNLLYKLDKSPKGYQIFAVSVGSNSGGISTINQMKYSADAYDLCGYNTIRLMDPSYELLEKQLNARVQFYSGHGSVNNIQFSNSGIWTLEGNESKDGKNFIQVDKVEKWKNNTILVTYMACNTAGVNVQDNSSISYRTVNEGQAETSIGFLKEIVPESAEQWAKNFSNKLAEGTGVYDAANYANTFIYKYSDVKKFALTYWNDKNVSIVDKKNKSVEKSRNIIDSNNCKKDNIEDFIKENDENFDLKNYEVITTDGGIAVNAQNGKITNNSKYIDYIFKIGDFYTEAGYTIELENDNVTHIYDNNIDLKKQYELLQNLKAFEITIDENKIEEYENNSIRKVEEKYHKNGIDTITENKYFYDIKTGKKYLIVVVKNKIINNGLISYSIDEVKYEL